LLAKPASARPAEPIPLGFTDSIARLTDLPIASRPVQIVVYACRFHCDAVLCGRCIFAERCEKNVLAP